MDIVIGGKSTILTEEIGQMVEEAVDSAFGILSQAWNIFLAKVRQEDPTSLFLGANFAEFVCMSNAIRNSGEFSPSSIQPVAVRTQGSPGKKSIRPKLKLAGATNSPPLGASKNLPAPRRNRFRV